MLVLFKTFGSGSEAEPLLDEVDPETFIADKAYDADPFMENSKTVRSHK
ncbi:hypothetical protein [Komagataeibacter nataicola]|nr:hypothetical protein [Komagataeibacter nataicola]WNM08892.1 hypothetical protein RI056_01885 [Komagataeibacter nataicola]